MENFIFGFKTIRVMIFIFLLFSVFQDVFLFYSFGFLPGDYLELIMSSSLNFLVFAVFFHVFIYGIVVFLFYMGVEDINKSIFGDKKGWIVRFLWGLFIVILPVFMLMYDEIVKFDVKFLLEFVLFASIVALILIASFLLKLFIINYIVLAGVQLLLGFVILIFIILLPKYFLGNIYFPGIVLVQAAVVYSILVLVVYMVLKIILELLKENKEKYELDIRSLVVLVIFLWVVLFFSNKDSIENIKNENVFFSFPVVSLKINLMNFSSPWESSGEVSNVIKCGKKTDNLVENKVKIFYIPFSDSKKVYFIYLENKNKIFKLKSIVVFNSEDNSCKRRDI